MESSSTAFQPLPCRYGLRHRSGRPGGGTAALRLLDLQPELLEHIATKLILTDLSALASTCHAASPLQCGVIGARCAALRALTVESHTHLITLIKKLPRCAARTEIATVIENSMSTFRSVCNCNEDFLRLSRAVALRGLAAPFQSPVDAARLARSCCETCDDVTRALQAVTGWLTELTQVVARTDRRGARAALQMTSEQSNPAGDAEPPGYDGGDSDSEPGTEEVDQEVDHADGDAAEPEGGPPGAGPAAPDPPADVGVAGDAAAEESGDR